MDGSHPIRITRDGDHQVVHLPPGVEVPTGAVVRQDGDRVIIEPASPKRNLVELLDQWAAEGPLEEYERMNPIDRPMPRPFDL